MDLISILPLTTGLTKQMMRMSFKIQIDRLLLLFSH